MELLMEASSSPITDLSPSNVSKRMLAASHKPQGVTDARIFQASEDSIYYFYEATLLLRMLGSTSKAPHHNANHTAGKRSSSTWHKFLDQLSWLGDSELGGNSVISIAVEEKVTGLHFWVASNGDVKTKTFNHLTWLLEQLQKVEQTPQWNQQHLVQQIFACSIDQSRKKVCNYARRLLKFVTRVQAAGTDDLSNSDRELFSTLKQLVAVHADPLCLCANAYQLRRSQSMVQLSDKRLRDEDFSDWSLIRHYVGRLGSWMKAARTVVSFARQAPALFRELQIEAVPNPRPSVIRWTRQLSTVEGVLQYLFPAFKSSPPGQGFKPLAESYQEFVTRTLRYKGDQVEFRPKDGDIRRFRNVTSKHHSYSRPEDFFKILESTTNLNHMFDSVTNLGQRAVADDLCERSYHIRVVERKMAVSSLKFTQQDTGAPPDHGRLSIVRLCLKVAANNLGLRCKTMILLEKGKRHVVRTLIVQQLIITTLFILTRFFDLKPDSMRQLGVLTQDVLNRT
ncbi:hypothetical protein AYO20_06943 [Fonsecaea nubica]|uniref:Uncharacterized protein n=1 Tax=Fonsecaea nubica TaxID=856822 RepID=A0A178CWD5_9EURO|nr:hypothetical protein AYO20_06943 [Fonsecaea nubica]OAL33767.1 hypothetical protein AYO20_06943 [Fonsecaea nubica]